MDMSGVMGIVMLCSCDVHLWINLVILWYYELLCDFDMYYVTSFVDFCDMCEWGCDIVLFVIDREYEMDCII